MLYRPRSSELDFGRIRPKSEIRILYLIFIFGVDYASTNFFKIGGGLICLIFKIVANWRNPLTMWFDSKEQGQNSISSSRGTSNYVGEEISLA